MATQPTFSITGGAVAKKPNFFEPVKTTTPATKQKQPGGIASTALETLKGLPKATFDIYKPIIEPVVKRTPLDPLLGKGTTEKIRKAIGPSEEEIAKRSITINGETFDPGDPLAALNFMNFGAGAQIGKQVVKATEPVVFDAMKYVEENVAKRMAAQSNDIGYVGSVKEFFKDMKQKIVDSNTPIEDTLAAVLKKNNMSLKPTEDITNQIDRVLRAPSIAGQFVKDKGLESIIRNVDDLNVLDEYLIARHGADVSAAGFETGRNVATDARLVEALKTKYEPFAEAVTEYSRKLLDYSTDSGLISKELADKLKIAYPRYVPMNRVFTELERAGSKFSTSRGVASLSRQTIVQALRGSEREVESPLVSLLSKTYDAFLQGERNKTAAMLRGYEKLPDNPFQIREIKVPIVPVAKITHVGQVFPEVMDKVAEIVRQYGGTLERKLKTGKLFGKFTPALNAITTKFGSSKDTLLHEFGHMLDTKFGLLTSDFFDKATNVELRKVADLRGDRAAYTRKGAEKIAEFISMYFSDFKNAMGVAPVTTKKFTEFLSDKPELRSLVSIMKSRARGVETIEETIFRPSVFEPSEPHFTLLENGEKKFFSTLPEVVAAAKSLNPQTLNILGRILAFPVRIARLGITGVNIPFVISNVARDQVTALINSRKGLQTSVANPMVYITALTQALGHGKLYDEIVRAGGMGTSFDIAREMAPKTIQAIRSGKDPASRIAFLVTNPSQLLRAVEDIVSRAEEFTRIKQYAGTKNALIKEGASEADAIAGAARAAREDSVNFLRRGDWGTVMNSAVLYLNASIQGTRTLFRALQERPVATATKIAVSTFTPVAISTLWNMDDEKRREAYADIAEYEKENYLIIVPPNPVKDEQGRWNVIKIPISQEVSKIASLPRRFLEQAHGLDPVSFGEIARALLGSVQPVDPTVRGAVSTLVPQALKPTIEGVTNTNLFTGLPILPERMKNLPPELQAKPETSGSARLLGGVTGTSPLKVENFIRSSLGGVGSQVINAVDNVLAKGGAIPPEQIGGESIATNVLRRLARATGGEMERKAIKNIQEAITDQEIDKFQLNFEAEQKFTQFKALPRERANEQFAELAKTNKPLAEQIKKITTAERLGLTASDRFLLQLNVTNGARAKFIFSLLADMKTKEEKNAYIKGLIDKDIVSTNVYAQLKELIKRSTK